MGDMGDMYRAFDEAKKDRKQDRMKRNLDWLNENEIEYEVHNKGYQLNFLTQTKRVVAFYPSTNKWVFRTTEGKVVTQHGDAKALVEWIKGEVI
jgi:hypothetical protein